MCLHGARSCGPRLRFWPSGPRLLPPQPLGQPTCAEAGSGCCCIRGNVKTQPARGKENEGVQPCMSVLPLFVRALVHALETGAGWGESESAQQPHKPPVFIILKLVVCAREQAGPGASAGPAPGGSRRPSSPSSGGDAGRAHLEPPRGTGWSGGWPPPVESTRLSWQDCSSRGFKLQCCTRPGVAAEWSGRRVKLTRRRSRLVSLTTHASESARAAVGA